MQWKAIVADDEAVIRSGIKKLIDWSRLGIEIVGLAEDGIQLEKMIGDILPDVVISDVKMPGQSGLEVLSKVKGSARVPQFIFVSGYGEFAYAKEAMQLGAVDYLLKPVRVEELEDAVQKALLHKKTQDTIRLFQEEKFRLEEAASLETGANASDGKTMKDILEDHGIDIAGKMFAGICIGIRPDLARQAENNSFERYNLIRFAIYNRISELFEENMEGFVVKRDDACLHLLTFFSEEEEAILYESNLLPIKKRIEEEYQIRLLVGIGMPSAYPEQLKNAYRTARYAFDLYYFEERPVILFQEIKKSFEESNEEYNRSVEEVFRSIVARDGETLKNVSQTLDLISEMFYGNRFATENRCMHFTGLIAERLMQYKMIKKDFYDLQDSLQEKVEQEVSFRGVRDVILAYYEDLLSHINETGKGKDSILIEDIKQYIRDHYMEEMSIGQLADVACVSKNYFSAMFKKETGMNYKAYLTQIRMEAALKLLQETDDRTYEISEKVGYNNVRRFVDAFKQIYSVTPAEYRKSLRGE